MNPNDDRMATAEAAAMLGMNTVALRSLIKRRGWETKPLPGIGKYVTLARADVEAELQARQNKASRPSPKLKTVIPSASPKDLAIAEKCARIIRDYWRQRGFDVHVEAVGVELVSDTRNGWPVRR